MGGAEKRYLAMRAVLEAKTGFIDVINWDRGRRVASNVCGTCMSRATVLGINQEG